MGRRRDAERYERMKRLNPDYKGFRGHRNEPDQPGKTPLAPATCRVCGRKRNVPVGVAMEQRDNYVCARCADHDSALEPAEARQKT